MKFAHSLVALSLALTWLQDHPGPVPKPVPKPRVIYALIVNAQNPAGEQGDAAEAMIKSLFLKNMTQWPGGTGARPYGREEGSAAQKAFMTRVLDMSEAELARHWLRVKSINGTTPPKQVDTDRMVLKYIARYEGAFGIVALDAITDVEGIRVLFEF